MSTETRSVPWQIAKAPQVLTASPTMISATVGGSQTVTLSFLGDGVTSAQSANTNIATVSGSGTTYSITGVAAGTTTITFRVAEGTNYQAAYVTVDADVVRGVTYIGTATSLSVARRGLAATNAGTNALFAGGETSTGGYVNAVDVYSSDLTKTTATALSQNRANLAGATTGNTAFFGGGLVMSVYYATVDGYNSDLTKIASVQNLSTNTRAWLAGATAGVYAMFGGGSGSSGGYYGNVDAYDSNGTKQPVIGDGTTSGLYGGGQSPAGTSAGTNAVFGGGYAGGYLDKVTAYSEELTRYNTTYYLSVARNALGAASTGDYAVFAGGAGSTSTVGTVDAFDPTLTRTTPTSIVARKNLAGATTGSNAVFVGGQDATDGSGYYATADAFDENLTRMTPNDMSSARSMLAGATADSYALFGGGVSYTTAWSFHDAVDVYRG